MGGVNTTELNVAVVGAGPAGLAAIKSLREEGFHVTGFERRPEPGGVWTFSSDPTFTSVTTQTKAQLSRFLTPFSDFPHSDAFPRHGTAAELGQYYREYADHFGLTDSIVFNVSVVSIRRDDATSKWLVHVEGEDAPRAFDKVVYAIGTEVIAKWPEIENLAGFTGKLIHGQGYKRPEDFEGMKVVVLGQGNSAADFAVEVAPHTSKVYLAHRRGAVVVPRMVDGKRFDQFATWKATRLGYWLGRMLPALSRKLLEAVFASAASKTWGEIEPEYRLEPEPQYFGNVSATIISDDLIPALRDGRVVSTHGIRRVKGPKTLEMDDGTVLEDVDAIIACTGYYTPFSMLGSSLTFSTPHPDIPAQPNLYQNLFSLDHPNSLACLNFLVAPENAASCRELASMAIAQVWAGKSELPSQRGMKQQIEAHHDWFVNRCLTQPVPQLEGLIDPDIWFPFVHEAAGTGMYEYLGWTWRGISFSLRDPLLYFKMAYGVNSPHCARFFETGKRKAWPQAREEIFRVNQLSSIDLSDSEKKDE